jgi:hypothetical protein
VHPLAKYLASLAEIRSSAAGTKETSYYPALHELLNDVGKDLKPKVRCILQLANRGAGSPDGGLYTADQFQKLTNEEPIAGQKPARGAVEIKSTKDDAWVTAKSDQVTKYWKEYGQVLVTNYRDFLLVGRDSEGKALKLASCRLAPNERAFWQIAGHPQKAEHEQGDRFLDFLKLVLLSPAILATPKDVAWVLAYYAREANFRVGAQAELPALASVRKALEQALGLRFEGEKGDHFFRSTLIQTLFYGVFSSWVLWSKQRTPISKDRFDWKLAQWSLKVPMIRALFEEVATPSKLGPLGVVEVLDWTTAVLNRVDRASFFAAFREQEAVQYFYEPFLEAFDPELRKELGVWYTPLEIVQYMVARTDEALRTELGIEDGLADKNVYVLDPACGTGAFLVEVLKSISRTLEAKGKDPLTAHAIKRAAIERIFGFEILPAPFVISHLQLGLVLQDMGAPFKDDGTERAGVFLTNSLTGWEPPRGPKEQLAFKELEEEREAAERVKQSAPILVVIGNPPYNGFAGVGMMEEKALVEPYRATRKAPAPQGQGLNDLYVRFFRVAERRIVDGTGQGIVCLISNYSWLDRLSHTGMRERFLDIFDLIRIDSLNGDKYRTGKVTPDGKPDPSVFSTEHNSEGIQVGTAIATMIRKPKHEPAREVEFRNFWGKDKRGELLDSLAHPEKFPCETLTPDVKLGLTFLPMRASADYGLWPTVLELLPENFPGVKSSRDRFLVDIERVNLEARIREYFDPGVTHQELRTRYPDILQDTQRFVAEKTRDFLRHRTEHKGRIVSFLYRAFDARWLYWEPETKLLDEKRIEFVAQVFQGNLFIEARQKESVDEFSRGTVTSILADNFGNGLSNFFPLFVRHDPAQQSLTGEPNAATCRLNLSKPAEHYMAAIDLDPAKHPFLFFHCIAMMHSPAYRQEHAGALKQDWPHIPLPSSPELLAASGALGQVVAQLLDVAKIAKGVTAGKIATELKLIGSIAPVTGKTIRPEKDLFIDAGWGHANKDGATMPGKGRAIERSYTREELASFEEGAARLGLPMDRIIGLLGEQTFDVYLNNGAYWSNVPQRVWEYTMGGHRVMKKWLSYREGKLMGRPITPEEAHEVRDMVRRIAAICLMGPQLDANYAAVKAKTYSWPRTDSAEDAAAPEKTAVKQALFE